MAGAAVLRDTPSLEALPATTPPAIRRLLSRCFERDPRQRLQAIDEAAHHAIDAFVGEAPQFDDITLLVVKGA